MTGMSWQTTIQTAKGKILPLNKRRQGPPKGKVQPLKSLKARPRTLQGRARGKIPPLNIRVIRYFMMIRIQRV